MKRGTEIAKRLQGKAVLLDGAMGTELQKRGLPAGVCPEAWCLENPAVVQEVHEAYRLAGSEVVYTATFGANRVKLSRYGLTDVRSINRELALIARRAVGSGGLVAGDIGPTGRFVEPFGDLTFSEAVSVFKEQAEGLLDGGVDLFVVETMMDIQEARAALIAIKELCGLFTLVTMTYERHGRTLNGTDPAAALVILQALGADAVGCNCSFGPDGMLPLLEAMRPLARVPLVAKPNAGLPRLEGDATHFDMDPKTFASFARPLVEAGAAFLGGCCGTTPEHIKALGEILPQLRPAGGEPRPEAALSSARASLPIGPGRPLVLVGSRLDAGKDPALVEALSGGDSSQLRQAVRQQEKEGAGLILVRSAPGSGPEGLCRMVQSLAPTTRLPFMVCAEEGGHLEKILRLLPGRPLACLRGGQEGWRDLLAVCRRYGALPVLGFPFGQGQAGGKALREAVALARRNGFSKEEIVVRIDPPDPAGRPGILEALVELAAFCRRKVGCLTMVDLRDVGRDLPGRPWLQAFLLAALQAAGLSFAVADALPPEVGHVAAAGALLSGRDPQGAAWRGRFQSINGR